MKTSIIIKTVAAVIGLLILFTVGILGVGINNQTHNSDQKVIYTGGQVWREGNNPYDPKNIKDKIHKPKPFAYPPQTANLLVPLSLLPFQQESILWDTMNIMLVIVIAFQIKSLTKKITINNTEEKQEQLLWISLAICIILNAPLYLALYQGQTSIIIATTTIGAWLLMHRKKEVSPILPGFLLSISLIKPQAVFFLFFWLLLEKRWKILACSALGTALLLLFPISKFGVGTISQFITGATYYASRKENTGKAILEGGLLYIGIYPLIAFSISIITGLLLVFIYWKNKNKFNEYDTIGILMTSSIIFIGRYHMYDLVSSIPLLISSIFYAMKYKKTIPIYIILFLLMSLPQKIVHLINTNSSLVRLLAVAGILVLTVTQSYKYKKNE